MVRREEQPGEERESDGFCVREDDVELSERSLVDRVEDESALTPLIGLAD